MATRPRAQASRLLRGAAQARAPQHAPSRALLGAHARASPFLGSALRPAPIVAGISHSAWVGAAASAETVTKETAVSGGFAGRVRISHIKARSWGRHAAPSAPPRPLGPPRPPGR
jgi:hypothetical protein